MVNFALVNENPVAVQILDLSLNMTESTIYAAAVEKGNSTTASIAISSNDYNVTLSVSILHCSRVWVSVENRWKYGHFYKYAQIDRPTDKASMVNHASA